MKILKKNYLLLISLLILNAISLFNMVNAKLISSSYNNAFLKQSIWIIIGYILLMLCKQINFKKTLKYAKYLYFFSLFLLIMVLFVGSNINGAKCWLSIFGISFQPSEICKITLLLMLIKVVKESKIGGFKDEFKLVIKLFFLTLIPSILVFLEPDTGAVINYLIIFFIVFFMSHINKWWYIVSVSLFATIIVLFFYLFFFKQDILINILGTNLFYRMDRIINFFNNNSYQLENSLITIGSASFLGVGFNKILLYIPEAPTDFIFSFTIGNFGILSGIIVLICFLVMDFYIIYKNNNLNKYKKIFVDSYLGIFIFHQIYNIFMNIGLVPIMGIPLPFLSYGGTSTIINFLFIGMILNIFSKKTT